MFDRDTDYPTAVASYDDEGVSAAIDWCIEHMETGDTLSVWTSLKSNLSNCAPLERLVQRHSNVAHITGRGGGTPRGAMQGWALAHGWTGKNPERLAQYARDINSGKRPRAGHVLRADYIEYLRQKLASGDDPGAED